MDKLTLGILAHVDAGKTTLSESLLYTSGSIRKLGRVDNKDTFLDTYELEKARGITIFSKQALICYEDLQITLLDTPGHVDFSAEMERTLQVLDAAILVISGMDGVQGHTKTLWRLLSRYQIPVFLFINKMDQPGRDKEDIFRELTTQLDDGCVDFTEEGTDNFYESLAMCEERLLNGFLETGQIDTEAIKKAIAARKVFPCFLGSALKLFGVEELMQGIRKYVTIPVYPKEFGARIFKITRDNQGNRLTHMKITGGILKARAELTPDEKVNQIRIYSGEKFESVNEALPGSICAVTGLQKTLPGQGLGREKDSELPLLEPIISYCIQLPEGCEAAVMMPKLLQLQEEDPMLHILWDENLQEIHAKVMGEVQIEVLKNIIYERFQTEVSFGMGRIVYKETIADTVEGVGHFEPLRHYAEVHLLLEPGEPGSGLCFASDCSEDVLSRNWQRLILTHLEEREHRGVLTGSPITDMKITLASGRAHLKHTEGGDFRQATYRAVRQGLMEASSVLLEPVYEFFLEIPETCIGRAMTDIEKFHGSCLITRRNGDEAQLTGSAPAAALQDYPKEVTAYTKGRGRLSCRLKGYEPCYNAQEVIAQCGYDPEADLRNPAASVFCAHGAGFVVPWNQVKDYMHLESCFSKDREALLQSAFEEELQKRRQAALNRQEMIREQNGEIAIGTDEIDRIIDRSANANKRADTDRKRAGWQQRRQGRGTSDKAAATRIYRGQDKKQEYLLVDGYNVIFAWEDLRELAELNLDSARGKLLDILCDYQAVRKCGLIVVFDAYRRKGHPEEVFDYHNIHVIYTKEAETADRFIEKFAYDNSKQYNITVATSDGLEQIIIRGQGCRLLSARDLFEEIGYFREKLREEYLDREPRDKNYLLDGISGEIRQQIEQWKGQNDNGGI